MENNKISVIVPVYNVEQYLPKCLDSILSQTFSEFECIIVDDCSKDNCPEICDEYAQKDNRIKVIHNYKNIGSSLSRRTGLKKSSGKYILFVDADDFIEIDMLEKMYHGGGGVPQDYDMVSCDYYKYDKLGNYQHKKTPELSDNVVENIKNCTLSYGSGYVWNKLIKKTVYEKVEFPKDGHLEDLFITTQTLSFSKRIRYINNALYHHQYNNYSIKHNKNIKSEWSRYKEGSRNIKKTIDFLKRNVDDNINIFEPELGIRIAKFKFYYPNPLLRNIKKTCRTILRFIIPVKSWREWLKNKYKSIKYSTNQ